MQSTVSQDRDKWIGGSDIPVIMGISPFQKRYDLLLFKAGLKEGTFEGNEYTEYGNVMEPKIRDYINQCFKMNYVEGKHEIEELGFRLHTDGECDDSILEIKTTSQMHETLDEYKVYLVQLLFYMMNTNSEYGTLAVYNRPEDFNEEFDSNRLQIIIFKIDDYKDLCNEIVEEIERFKTDLNRLKENPLLTEEELLPTSVQELSKQIIAIENQMAEYKQLEQKQKELKEHLYKAMMENNVKKWETPNGTKITLVEATEDKMEMVFNEDKFKEEQAPIYASYCEEKLKKGRSGYIKVTLGKNE